jgi:hypothetical protein
MPYQVVENLLRGRSAALPLTQNLNVPKGVRLASSFACALHNGLLMTIFNNLVDLIRGVRTNFAVSPSEGSPPGYPAPR